MVTDHPPGRAARMPSPKLRAAARLDRILDAAGALLRETGGVGFTMKDVATRAGVAPATPYNLLGTKDGLLYALLNRALDPLFIGVLRHKAADALEHPIEAAAFAAELYTSDPIVYRELSRVYLSTPDDLHRPWFMHRSMSFWKHAIEVAILQKRLPADEADRDDLPRLLMIHFIGCVDLWVNHDLDDAGFRAQVAYGTSLIMLGFADAAGQRKLLARIREAKRTLPRHHANHHRNDDNKSAAQASDTRLVGSLAPGPRRGALP